jgi:hypothetical protein
VRSVTPSRYGADDWTCTSINRFTRPEPSYSATSAKHERKDSNPVRQFWRLTALPGAHSCKKGVRRESNPYLSHHKRPCIQIHHRHQTVR